MNFFTRNEVLQHNSKTDCWVIVRNQVFDISPFLAKHPGGADILLSRAGEDATSYFITKHGKNKKVWEHLETLKIGELHKNEWVTANDFDEAFLMELIDLCYQKKLYKIPRWYKNPFFWLRLVNISLFFGLSALALYAQLAWYVCIPLVILQAIVGTSLFGLVAHENTHRNFPKNKIGRFFLRVSWPIMWPFISQTPLRYEHNSHHIKIGDPEFDYEVAAFAPFIRYSGLVAHAAPHKHQFKSARFLYPFYANIITTIGGIKSSFWENHNRKVGVEHTLSIIATFTYFVGIPFLVHGSLWWFILLYLIYQCVLFYGIYIGAAINHFVPTAHTLIPDEHKNKYAFYVCHNTTNFCTSSPFWFWYTGGFNIQIEHHLIPFVPVENLRKMVAVVKDLCHKHGYPYHDYRTFRQLWNDHYAYLSSLSVPTHGPSPEIINKTGYQAR